MYIVYFLVRASVMLFVLRLLPVYRKRQQRIVVVFFCVNFFVTLYSCITFGISCIPFEANWKTIAGSKCFSKNYLVVTNQVNACMELALHEC